MAAPAANEAAQHIQFDAIEPLPRNSDSLSKAAVPGGSPGEPHDIDDEEKARRIADQDMNKERKQVGCFSLWDACGYRQVTLPPF